MYMRNYSVDCLGSSVAAAAAGDAGCKRHAVFKLDCLPEAHSPPFPACPLLFTLHLGSSTLWLLFIRFSHALFSHPPRFRFAPLASAAGFGPGRALGIIYYTWPFRYTSCLGTFSSYMGPQRMHNSYFSSVAFRGRNGFFFFVLIFFGVLQLNILIH